MENVMKNPYEEEAARLQEMIRALGSLLDELADTTPPPSHQSRRLRKVSPAVIRRSIAGLRSGELRPIDPSRDPIAFADELEAALELWVELEKAGPVLEQITRSLSSTMESKVQKTLPEALEFYREARKLARTSDNETLKEHVRRMDRALGRGKRR
jgi:hypothetical protein